MKIRIFERKQIFYRYFTIIAVLYFGCVLFLSPFKVKTLFLFISARRNCFFMFARPFLFFFDIINPLPLIRNFYEEFSGGQKTVLLILFFVRRSICEMGRNSLRIRTKLKDVPTALN